MQKGNIYVTPIILFIYSNLKVNIYRDLTFSKNIYISIL